MSKLNPNGTRNVNIRTVAAKRSETLAYSANGNLQFKKEPLQKLYEIAVNTLFGKDLQYKSSDSLVKEMRALVKAAVDDKAYDFVANLAIHARTEMNIRTIPLVLVVEFAKAISDKRLTVVEAIKKAQSKRYPGLGTNLPNMDRDAIAELQGNADELAYPNMRRLVCDVIQRADQINDLYAYALDVFGSKKAVPMAIKRGVADAFNKFGEYHFAKYNRDGSVKFRDVLRIVHPVPKSDIQAQLFAKIMTESLEAPYTWEVELSRNGQLPVGERKTDKQLWTELVSSGKVGYMALLRNLRNIHSASLDADVLKKYVYNVISDPEQVRKSKQLPFDFIEAYHIVKALDGKMATAVSKALDASVANIPKMGEKVWLIVDYSGSMGYDPDEKNIGYYANHATTKTAFATATTLAAALIKAHDDSTELAITAFGSTAMNVNGLDTNASVLGIKSQLMALRTGSIAGSTNFGAALDMKKTIGFVPDTIIVLSDNDVNQFPYQKVKDLDKKALKLAVNLSVTSTTPLSPKDGWFAASGWSTAMFKWMGAARQAGSIVDKLAVPYIGLPLKRPRVDKDTVLA